LGHAPVSPLAHYLAAEQNRSLFETWGVVQIVLSGLFFLLLLFGTRVGKFPLAVALLMVVIAIGERVATPGIEMVGRAVDFNPDPSHRVRLARDVLSYGFTTAEAAKFLLAAIAAVCLVWPRKRRSFDARHQIDLVDKTDYRHIDR
jgi:membrane protein required for beta-lactamase induction